MCRSTSLYFNLFPFISMFLYFSELQISLLTFLILASSILITFRSQVINPLISTSTSVVWVQTAAEKPRWIVAFSFSASSMMQALVASSEVLPLAPYQDGAGIFGQRILRIDLFCPNCFDLVAGGFPGLTVHWNRQKHSQQKQKIFHFFHNRINF